MSRRYTVDGLLKLRESPLVGKPSSLPPQEEWMGTTQDVTARRTSALRGKPDDTILQGEGFQKRPGLLDHQRKSATTSSELFLGPRKFGSARKGNSHDELDESSQSKDSAGSQDQPKNGDETRDRFADRRGARHDGLNGRYSSRAEGDDFQRGTFRRRDDKDDTEGRARRDTEEARDRPRWRARHGQEDLSAVDDERDRAGEDGRQGQRRDTQGRAKFEQPWFRNDKTAEFANDRGDTKQHEWRGNRDWDRSGRAEADPEWMDSTEIEEPAQAHTQEDFQRWKERMKAGGTPAEEKPEMISRIVTDPVTLAEVKKAADVPSSAVLNSLEVSDAMDKFFARFNEPKVDQEVKPQAKAPNKTRFAALWSAPPELSPPATAAPVSDKDTSQIQTPSQADADQAGFARILQMLGSRSSSSTPQDQMPQKPKTPLYAKPDQPGPQERLKSPDHKSMTSDNDQPLRNRTVRVQEFAGSERLLDSRSPIEAAHTRQESGPSKETSEILLNLMRQANLGKQSQPGQFSSNEFPQQPGLVPSTENLNRTATSRNQLTSVNPGREPGMPQRREKGSSFYDESQLPGISYQEEQGLQDFQNNGLRRPPTNGPPPAFLDESYLGNLRQNALPPPKGFVGNHVPGQGLPPGLHRPPGLDQMPRVPPGWPNQQQPQQQQQLPQRQAPPPGTANLSRGMPAPFGTSNPGMPISQHLQQQQQQQQQQLPPRPGMQRPQRKYTGDSGQSYPPGMGPPPGFVNAGPPPGFPGAGMPQSYGRYQIGNEPQGMGRGFTELYGNGQAERAILRGGAGPPGNGMPGPYR